MKRIGFLLFLIAKVYIAKGQVEPVENQLKLNAKLDLHSSHLWRGFKNGNALSIQPTILVEKGALNVGAWAAYAINDSYFEVDLFAEYSYKSITVSLYDYYCPQSTQMNGFLEFRKLHTRHTLDAMISWSPKEIPFKVFVSTFLFGDDISSKDGRQAYSTYVEPAITWKLNRFSGEIFTGFTPYSGYYSSKSAFVNFGTAISYKLNIGEYELPIQSKISYNPIAKVFYYMVGFTLATK